MADSIFPARLRDDANPNRPSAVFDTVRECLAGGPPPPFVDVPIAPMVPANQSTPSPQKPANPGAGGAVAASGHFRN